MTGRILTFHLCGHLFGIDITEVKEIDRNIEYTNVPGSQSHIAGLFNMRGQVVSLLNLGRILSYKEDDNGRKSCCIILKQKQIDPNFVGFLIDRPGNVVDIVSEWCEPPPANIGKIEVGFLKELVKYKEDIILLINSDKVVNV